MKAGISVFRGPSVHFGWEMRAIPPKEGQTTERVRAHMQAQRPTEDEWDHTFYQGNSQCANVTRFSSSDTIQISL